MAEILKIADPTRDRRCAACHVAGSPEKSASDGVACEACHGAAIEWLGPHTQANAHPESVKRGMTDLRDVVARAKACLGCHLGRGEQNVDHDMIAAGHPDLAFELDTFSFAQPSHRRPASAQERARAWAVGQSVALSEGMQLLGRHAAKGWPEFSDFECYQCHHDLRLESWRIQRGYGTRRPGSLQLNLARFATLREAAPEVEECIRALLAANPHDGAAVARAAAAVERSADALTARFVAQDVDSASMLRAIGAGIERIADSGAHAAEQATMALDALSAALGRRPAGVAALYSYLERPSAYRPGEFVALYRKAGE
jgi:cytochrome c556